MPSPFLALGRCRWNWPTPVTFRPLASGPLRRPRCQRQDPDQPLGPKVTKIVRALESATYLSLYESGAPPSRLLPLAISICVDELIDACTNPTGRSQFDAEVQPPRPPSVSGDVLDR